MTDAVQIWAQRYGVSEEEAARWLDGAKARADMRARLLAQRFEGDAAARKRLLPQPAISDFEIMLRREIRRLDSGSPVISIVAAGVIVIAVGASMIALALM
jgi:hypothetical protein